MRATNQLTLKDARIATGLSLQEVEDKTDYSVKRIAWLEENSEELTVGEMKEFCELYGVDLDKVYFGANEKVKNYEFELWIATSLANLVEIKCKMAETLMLVYDPEEFTVENISIIVREVLSEIEVEEEVLKNKLKSHIEGKQNSLNTTLAGNC
jgi:transcriptional regulator with XRE-family HTH domain